MQQRQQRQAWRPIMIMHTPPTLSSTSSYSLETGLAGTSPPLSPLSHLSRSLYLAANEEVGPMIRPVLSAHRDSFPIIQDIPYYHHLHHTAARSKSTTPQAKIPPTTSFTYTHSHSHPEQPGTVQRLLGPGRSVPRTARDRDLGCFAARGSWLAEDGHAELDSKRSKELTACAITQRRAPTRDVRCRIF